MFYKTVVSVFSLIHFNGVRQNYIYYIVLCVLKCNTYKFKCFNNCREGVLLEYIPDRTLKLFIFIVCRLVSG